MASCIGVYRRVPAWVVVQPARANTQLFHHGLLHDTDRESNFGAEQWSGGGTSIKKNKRASCFQGYGKILKQ